MTAFTLSKEQTRVAEGPLERKLFLEGAAGTGKTTAGVARLLHLLAVGIRADAILVLVPQRTLAAPYYAALRRSDVPAGGQVTILTAGGLAQRTVDLFWPLAAEAAGFAHPEHPPTFLTLETAQYHMASLVRPLLERGFFESIVIDRNRLYSQILDNLNKSAAVGFPFTEIGERLKDSWGGKESQRRIYDEAQECAARFRAHCLAHNLLDFSLQFEAFKILWAVPLCRNYLLETYTHLVVDNVEEDVPVAHDLLRHWLPACRSALLIHDREAGYRRFLGADPQGGRALSELCDEGMILTETFVSSPHVRAFGRALADSLKQPLDRGILPLGDRRRPTGDARMALVYATHRYYPQMLDWVAGEIGRSVHDEGISPGEIVVLAPFLPDALRFALANRLEAHNVPVRSHRPSRALRDEPAARCLLTLSALAHPHWGDCPSSFDVAYALVQAIEGLDPVRAQLLTHCVYRPADGRPALLSFDHIAPDMQERLTYSLGGRYEQLRLWLEAHAALPPPERRFDHFLSGLFGELLSQAGFAFHRRLDAGRVAANLIESVRKFQEVVAGESARPLGLEYLQMVRDGVIAAQYLTNWRLSPEDAVLLTPAHTFLMSNRPVDVQFWLDVGSKGWSERLYQPLTHPYVLSRRWEPGRVWSDADEFQAGQETLGRLAQGLVRRCRRRICLGLCELSGSGMETSGQLLQAIQRVLRRLPEREAADV